MPKSKQTKKNKQKASIIIRKYNYKSTQIFIFRFFCHSMSKVYV